MNAAQQASLNELKRKHPEHIIKVQGSPVGDRVSCSCRWSRNFNQNNALARAAKRVAAIREHLESLDE